MEELGKRKVDDSKKNDNGEASTSRQNKVRKLNHPPEALQDSVTQILSHDGPKGSNLTQRLVSMWLGGTQGHDSLLTQEVTIFDYVISDQLPKFLFIIIFFFT